ncbi:MAG: hypothetical protein ACRCW6_01205, partial [Mycoplasmoidaceae bacterium]
WTINYKCLEGTNMIKYGIGGNHTKTGIKYQSHKSLINVFKEIPNYKVEEQKDNNGEYDILYNNKLVAKIFNSHSIYKFLLKKHKIDWKNHISAKLIPDDSIFVYKNNNFYIIEIKWQEVSGSTDEKLQTCDFKRKQWTKLLSNLNINKVEYFYILNDWFRDSKYKDVLDYIISVNCKYFFEYIPLNEFGLLTE